MASCKYQKSDLIITIIDNSSRLEKAMEVRINVFVCEQGVPEEEEIDGYDFNPWDHNKAVHFLAELQGVSVGTARVILPDSQNNQITPLIQRVAVLKQFRGNNYGHKIMEKVHDYIKNKNYKAAELSAQTYAIEFYEKLGYESYGDLYIDAGIEHIKMKIEF